MKISLNDHIEGKECVGISGIDKRIKSVKGWVDNEINDHNHNIVGYSIQADDNYKGHRGTMVTYEYGDIKVLPHKERLIL